MHIAKQGKGQNESTTTYASRYMSHVVPKHHLPAQGMPADAAKRIILDELNLDGNPALNTASFVTTWMEPEADELLLKTSDINFIDFDEYPTTSAIHQRVVNMMADILNAPKAVEGDNHSAAAMGTATVGSSEAIMLGLLAHKWSWKKKREAAGLDTSRPNVVFGADVHSCWEKFALYFDVEQRIIPMKQGNYTIGPADVEPLLDENTIAVGVVVGTTFTGQNDDFTGINELLLRIRAGKGWDIPIHVDGASGGFVMAFAHPEVAWDFRLEQVRSINVSNHKFGLVYPGMGIVIFRDQSCVPGELVFKINYLGGEMLNYSLNFSRSASQVYLQYYNFLRLGRDGYTRIMTNIMKNAGYLEKRLLALNRFELLTDSNYLPVVVLKLKDDSSYTVFQICELLRERGWTVPAYTLPPDAQDVAVLRVVVKENFSHDMAEMFAADMKGALNRLDMDQPKRRHPGKAKKNHIC
jgi:glutamate decarboxylase